MAAVYRENGDGLENPKLKLVQKRRVIIKKGKSVDLVVKMK